MKEYPFKDNYRSPVIDLDQEREKRRKKAKVIPLFTGYFKRVK